jgi:hypothetical protein
VAVDVAQFVGFPIWHIVYSTTYIPGRVDAGKYILPSTSVTPVRLFVPVNVTDTLVVVACTPERVSLVRRLCIPPLPYAYVWVDGDACIAVVDITIVTMVVSHVSDVYVPHIWYVTTYVPGRVPAGTVIAPVVGLYVSPVRDPLSCIVSTTFPVCARTPLYVSLVSGYIVCVGPKGYVYVSGRASIGGTTNTIVAVDGADTAPARSVIVYGNTTVPVPAKVGSTVSRAGSYPDIVDPDSMSTPL